MGVVIKQSFWGTIIAYFGAVIGYFNSLYLRPEYLTMSEIGVFGLITANAMMLSPFCSAGMPSAWIREFPGLSSEKGAKNQYFTFLLVIILLINAIVIGGIFWLEDHIAEYYSVGSPEYVKYLWISAIVLIINGLFEMLYAYCRTMLSVLVPNFLREVFLRTGAIVLVGGLAIGYWDFSSAAKGLAVVYFSALVILFFYLIAFKGLRVTFSLDQIHKKLRLRTIRLGGYFMLFGLSFALMNNAGYSQITSILGDEANGIFQTCFFIGVIVEMPRRNMSLIIAPLISSAMQKQDMIEVQRMYVKGSVTMASIGALITIGIVTNVADLFLIIPQGEQFATGFYVIIAICLAKLTVMLFSFSSEIILFSKHYKVLLISQLISAVIMIVANFFLIPIFGLSAAGWSYLLSIFIYTVVKFILVQRWFNIRLFVGNHLYLLAVSALVLIVFLFLPLPFALLVNIILRSILTTLFFGSLIYVFKVSEDINGLVDTLIIKRLRQK